MSQQQQGMPNLPMMSGGQMASTGQTPSQHPAAAGILQTTQHQQMPPQAPPGVTSTVDQHPMSGLDAQGKPYSSS
jgi:hypothetical protein